MQKVWVHQRKNRKGWFVGWYVDGKRKSKAVPNKALAERFARRKRHQLNEDVYPDPVKMLWDDLVKEHLTHKRDVEGRAQDTLRISRVALEKFKQVNGPLASTSVGQRHVDAFVAFRLTEVAKNTVNRDLRALRTFVNWSIKYRYMGPGAREISWTMQRAPVRRAKSLTADERKSLCVAAKASRYSDYIRVLLAMTTGLRKEDIEQLKIVDVDFKAATVRTFSKKSGKSMPNRPLPKKVAAELARYRKSLPKGQERLFAGKLYHKRWKKIRGQAGLPKLKFHDLRKTFGSILAQKGFSQSVVQDLLEHSTPRLTHEIYTDVEPVYRKAIDSIPMKGITGL